MTAGHNIGIESIEATETTESVDPAESDELVEPVGMVVEHPITPIVSDATPTRAAPAITDEAVPVLPVVQSLDLTMPILDVLTSPNI